MAKKYPGLYLYFDWLRALVKLPPEVAMRIIENLYHYAEDSIEPRPMEELSYNIIQDMFLEQLRRSKANSQNGHMGGMARTQRYTKPEPYERKYGMPDIMDLPEYPMPELSPEDEKRVREILNSHGIYACDDNP